MRRVGLHRWHATPTTCKGLCLSPAINISGSTIVECTAATGNDTCADYLPGGRRRQHPDDEAPSPRCWNGASVTAAPAIDGCEDDNDLDDQSWENPFDVSKGHRGFLDGDFVMMMYAWSPNWKANCGRQRPLQPVRAALVRRRPDLDHHPGMTWAAIGTTATENYCVNTASADCVGTEFTYDAGDFEQGRNVSQLIGNKITILDPALHAHRRPEALPDHPHRLADRQWHLHQKTLPYVDDLSARSFQVLHDLRDRRQHHRG